MPGPFGIGDLGDDAYAFVDFLSQSGQTFWQVLPLGPTGYGDSPYACKSAFAGNPLLISPNRMVADGLLTSESLKDSPTVPSGRVQYKAVAEFKQRLFARAFDAFKLQPSRAEFETFLHGDAFWLDDYALYHALKDRHGGASWVDWEPELAKRDEGALAKARDEHRNAIEAHKLQQFLFFKQWSALRTYCREKNVLLIGDIPIFVAHDSADVWSRQELFKLEPNGQPTVVAGVPPDYFSKTGQRWGNPIYHWDRMQQTGFRWWIERVRAAFTLLDVLRIDHFRGFVAAWEVPGTDATAERGQWVRVPGRELFGAIKEALGDVAVIAEDLGDITPEVHALRDDLGFPGMRVLQFAFGGSSDSRDLPHNYVQNAVVYTGTHDNDTSVGWFKSLRDRSSNRDKAQMKREREFCLKYLNSNGREFHWDLIRAAMASVANTALVPLQDVLGLGTEARMNLPATAEGNWGWRYESGILTEKLSTRLREMTETYGRART